METLNVPAPVSPEPAEVRGYASRLRQFHRLLATAMIVIAVAALVEVVVGGRLWLPWAIVGCAIGLSSFDRVGRDLWLGRDGWERSLRAALALPRSC